VKVGADLAAQEENKRKDESNMAKFEYHIKGNFDYVLHSIDNGILRASLSASREDSSDFQIDNIRCAVRVYERYSAIGSNRVSLNVTLFGEDDKVFLSAITSGGSQAILFKMNTLGEEAFLQCLVNILQRL
jgi:hypothetical protein